jgi:DnaJ-class molecular chaperone
MRHDHIIGATNCGCDWHPSCVDPQAKDYFPRVERCPDCKGDGIRWFNPDLPMGDCGARDYEPCRTCDGAGRIIPPSWLGNGTP